MEAYLDYLSLRYAIRLHFLPHLPCLRATLQPTKYTYEPPRTAPVVQPEQAPHMSHLTYFNKSLRRYQPTPGRYQTHHGDRPTQEQVPGPTHAGTEYPGNLYGNKNSGQSINTNRCTRSHALGQVPGSTYVGNKYPGCIYAGKLEVSLQHDLFLIPSQLSLTSNKTPIQGKRKVYR
jgi:hypothetical protein